LGGARTTVQPRWQPEVESGDINRSRNTAGAQHADVVRNGATIDEANGLKQTPRRESDDHCRRNVYMLQHLLQHRETHGPVLMLGQNHQALEPVRWGLDPPIPEFDWDRSQVTYDCSVSQVYDGRNIGARSCRIQSRSFRACTA
jgi:hypothetical protein